YELAARGAANAAASTGSPLKSYVRGANNRMYPANPLRCLRIDLCSPVAMESLLGKPRNPTKSTIHHAPVFHRFLRRTLESTSEPTAQMKSQVLPVFPRRRISLDLGVDATACLHHAAAPNHHNRQDRFQWLKTLLPSLFRFIKPR